MWDILGECLNEDKKECVGYFEEDEVLMRMRECVGSFRRKFK